MPRAIPSVLIGVHLTAASQDLFDTVRALHETTAQPFDVVILVDPGPSEAAVLIAKLEPLGQIRQLTVLAPGGGPASFNRLVSQAADIYVFIEAGARPGPNWLSLMLAALDADAANGLAGPSTNRCWNEQGVAPDCGASALDVERQSKALLQRHGAAWQSMAPLYSLSDFCLAVRREVVAVIGAADTEYGRGPCWEMDYGVRAARAGFGSVWAKAAFVRRGPSPAWRLASESALFEVNKRLYQDRFCGRRAREGGGSPYHAHCLGEACADFAPAAATRIHQPLPMTLAEPAAPSVLPLISCVMPTRGRPQFVAQSIAYFRQQDYPNRELIIVYEDDADLPEGLDDRNIRTVRTAQGIVGVKREEAARAARGEIIAHWDDDDWYGPQRLSRQALPILQGVADITGLNDMLFMSIAAREFWAVTAELFRRLFAENVSGGTLMFRRDVWRRSGPYPAKSLREDAEFMLKSMQDGARLCPLPGRDLCVYVRHGRNTWKFAEGRYLLQSDWSLVPEPDFLAADRSFYFPRPLTSMHAVGPPTLVSCIMPTANRRAFVAQAVSHFLKQDYPERELIVVDDGEDPVADMIPDENSIRYVRLDRRVSIGAKRNIACELARGGVIAHWDDDDWMAPGWLSSQVDTLLSKAAEICGLDKVFFYAPETKQGWRYIYDGQQPWLCGGTLCYTKAYWARAPFSNVNIGEDNAFVCSPHPKRMTVNVRDELYVATIHRNNSSPKVTSGQRWHRFPAQRLEALMHAADRGG